MNVQDLINILKQYPEDAEVMIYGEEPVDFVRGWPNQEDLCTEVVLSSKGPETKTAILPIRGL